METEPNPANITCAMREDRPLWGVLGMVIRKPARHDRVFLRAVIQRVCCAAAGRRATRVSGSDPKDRNPAAVKAAPESWHILPGECGVPSGLAIEPERASPGIDRGPVGHERSTEGVPLDARRLTA